MARRVDVHSAFMDAVQIEPNGRKVVTTARFIAELKKVNLFYDAEQANAHITRNELGWRLIDEGERGMNKYFKIF
ncbi:DNA polymerase V [Yersinia proxima]|uniref:DNA polymerase V n=1 Tax=Yersinia proxima TaxID=2890316 RepID=UPI001D1294D0|nr:DNA polymerase V [Yersinia proxima]